MVKYCYLINFFILVTDIAPQQQSPQQPSRRASTSQSLPPFNLFKERHLDATPSSSSVHHTENDFDYLLKEHTRKRSDNNTPYLRMDNNTPSPPPSSPNSNNNNNNGNINYKRKVGNHGLSASAPVIYHPSSSSTSSSTPSSSSLFPASPTTIGQKSIFEQPVLHVAPRAIVSTLPTSTHSTFFDQRSDPPSTTQTHVAPSSPIIIPTPTIQNSKSTQLAVDLDASSDVGILINNSFDFFAQDNNQ